MGKAQLILSLRLSGIIFISNYRIQWKNTPGIPVTEYPGALCFQSFRDYSLSTLRTIQIPSSPCFSG